jgi:hypothetical protein
MSSIISEDRKMKDLAIRVGEDISQLRRDISSIFSHTGRYTLTRGARELVEHARERLSAG